MSSTVRLIIATALIFLCKSSFAAPENSTQFGDLWICNEGYEKSGDQCERIIAPKNAHIIGNMWMCDEGYRKVGNSCHRLSVPANAYVIGNMWLCEDGYKKVGNRCQQLSEREIQQREELARIIAQRQAELRSRGASGQSCQTEYETGARVCLSVSVADLDCDEDIYGDYYDDCEVEVDYSLETDYRGSSSINVDVECEAEISYESNSYLSKSDDENFSESHSLSSYDSTYNQADFDFSFSSLEEVYSVELDDAWCEIQDTYLY